MKYIALTFVLALLVACSGNSSPPRNLDDACRMKAERPKWFKELSKAERKWGVPQAVFLATIYQESKFVAKARTPHRFALGIIPMGRQSGTAKIPAIAGQSVTGSMMRWISWVGT